MRYINSKLFCALLLLSILCILEKVEAQTKIETQTYTLDTPYFVECIKPTHTLGKKPKNVILVIGDGMSLMHIYTAWVANRGHLYLDNVQAVGLSKTYCANKLITDSGAGGTAMASGVKTNYHAIGVDPDGKPLTTILDLAKLKGKGTGVAVTCRLWDATPASFCCHNSDRDASEELIMLDYLDADVDYVFGGGAKRMQGRRDGRNLFSELQERGYQTPRSWETLESISSGKVFAAVDTVDTPLPSERGDLLARAALKGVDLLSKHQAGFVMMVEGSQLDDYGHFNDLDLLMQEIHDLDRTIGALMKWAAKDGETLIVVTADHETGGLTLLDGDKDMGRVTCHFSTRGHSGVMVPVYAFGPGAEHFTGIYENTDIFHRIKSLLGL